MTLQIQKNIRLFHNVYKRSRSKCSSHLTNFTKPILLSHDYRNVIVQTLPFQWKNFSSIKDIQQKNPISVRGVKFDHQDEMDVEVNEAAVRARVKLDILERVKDAADQVKAMYIFSMSKAEQGDKLRFNHNLSDDWISKEGEVADAFSKAIKYTAKLRTQDSAKKAEQLLREMIARHNSIQSRSRFMIGTDKYELNDEDIDDLLKLIEKDFGKSVTKSRMMERDRSDIPVPDINDFTNVLHAWASSKVRKKGIYAEVILYRIIELAYLYPEKFSMPQSNTFGLVVKCYAGSTFKDALSRIQKLHATHNRLADLSYPGIVQNDPFLLMHSIKSVNNINTKNEYMIVDEWFDRLHSYVMQPSIESNVSSESVKGKIDLTGTYSSIIRCYSRMRWANDAPQKTFDALQRMISLAQRCKERDDSCATVDLKINAFNLFLGMSTTFDDTATMEQKLSVLDSMVQAANNCLDSTATNTLIPLPNDQSFASCIKAISTIKDTHRAIKEAEKVVDTFESLQQQNSAIEPSTKVYNALIDFYIDISARDKKIAQHLYSICDDIRNRMKTQTPSLEPDAMTHTLLLKSCTINDGNVDNKEQKLQRAREIFDKISKHHDKEEGSKLNDKCYFYMMKCVTQNVNDPEEKKKQIIQLFSQAGSGGFVSSDVLKSLRINTTDNEYKKIVGDGRLADKWVANVTSAVALYTDGTSGGAGKNARRKGKSTSDWAKKQRQRDEEIKRRKIVKAEKKKKRMIKVEIASGK